MALVTHKFKLDLTPGAARQVLYTSQGDIGRPFEADLYWNGSPWTATGTTASIRGKKPDDTVFDYTATVSGTAVTFETTEQMTIISGPVECELVFSQGDDVIASANFVLMVEDSPYDPAAPSESVVPGIAELVENAVDDVIGTDVRDETREWLDEHPEATTTIQDGAVTRAKLSNDIILELDNMVADSARAKQKTIMSELFKTKYIGHKGFSGWIDGTTSHGVVPCNSLSALDFAKEAGILFVETDTTILSDGTWIISHEMDTSDLSGTRENLIDIDLNNFKSRVVIREYLTSGTYWTYDSDEQHAPLTLKEFLTRAKELGLYVLPEVKWLEDGFTNSNWEEFAEVVKSCGMENNIIIYTPYSAYMDGMKAYLPNTAVCYSGITDETVDTQLSHIAQYPFAFACTGVQNYSTILSKCLEAGIPLGLWVVDDYDTAKKFINDGGSFVITNCLTERIDSNRGILWNEIATDEFYKRCKKYLDTGTETFAGDIVTISTTTYALVYLQDIPCEERDIIVVSADIKTDGVASGQIVINNTLSVPARRRVVHSTKATAWETMTSVFFCGENDTTVNVLLSSITSGGASGTAYFRNVVVKHYRISEVTAWHDLTNISYAKTGKVVTVTKKASSTVSASTWTTIDSLPFPLYPTKDLEFPILANGTGSVTGIMRIDHYGDVKLYCSSASSGQYFTVSFVAI